MDDFFGNPGAPKKLPLTGLCFSIAGMVDNISIMECRQLVIDNGANFYDTVSSGVTHLISSSDMEVVFDNEYKCQFFPTLRPQVAAAKANKIPIVSIDFVHKCISSGKRVREGPFYLFSPKDASEGAEFQSKLDPRIQDVVNLLFDESEMERTLSDMKLDSKRLLAVVTSETVKQAYSVLAELDGLVMSTPYQPAQKAEQASKIGQLSSRFFALVPHQGNPPPLSTPEMVKEKLKMMEALTDIEVAARLMKEGKVGGSLSQVDVKYRKLKCNIEPIEKHTQEFSFIEQLKMPSKWKGVVAFRYVSHGSREGEAERFVPYLRLPNHRLLWHGSRFTNFIGILTQGLRVAPPEAPVTGYFLGKGIYFADMCSKSAEYCHATKENNYGLLLLCEVALGRWFQIAHGKFIGKEDLDGAGFHSTKGCGELAPDPSFDFTTSDGYIIPLGHETDTGVLCSELPHNEFIVYDPAQA